MIKPSLNWYIFALRFTQAQRYALLVCTLASSCSLWYFFSYAPLTKQLQRLTEKKRVTEKELVALESRSSGAVAACPIGSSCDTLNSLLHSIAKHERQLLSLDQKEAPDSPILTVSMELKGRFASLLSLLHTVIESLPSIKIESLELKLSEKSLVACLFVFSFYGERCEKLL